MLSAAAALGQQTFAVIRKEAGELVVGAASSRETKRSPAAGIPQGFCNGNAGFLDERDGFYRWIIKGRRL